MDNDPVGMYPSLDELLAAYDSMTLPDSLVAMLNQRYNEHGSEYASSVVHPDGRIVNQCMHKDSILDAQEELNDAIFNLLVVCFKQGMGQRPSGMLPWRPRAALSLLIQAWEAISPNWIPADGRQAPR